MSKRLVYFLLSFTLLPLALTTSPVTSQKPPNIVIIVADDLGFNDVSFRGSNEFLTPNIDALAYNGIILDRFYTPPMCTPSRAALMTGKHPIHLGMQHYVIANDEPWGMPEKEATIAELFREAGYSTSLIGKWHLGFAKAIYTPLERGFDRHFGYWGAYVDYYDHTLYTKNYSAGHDFRINSTSDRTHVGQYMTDVLTDEAVRQISTSDPEKPMLMVITHLAPHTGNTNKPLQAPKEEVKKFNYIPGIERRTYAAMVSKLDTSVGKVVKALGDKGILNNTVIVFYSDNGAPMLGLHNNHGDNSPFRGQKNSPWEGALRVPAIIWSQHTRSHRSEGIWDQYMHVMDLLPTLASAAGILPDRLPNMDGISLWRRLKRLETPLPRPLLHNIDDTFKYAAYSKGDFKYVSGTTNNGEYDGWLRSDVVNYSDPRAGNYPHAIRSSLVWAAMEQHNYTEHIQMMSKRSRARVQCIQPPGEVIPCTATREECLFNLRWDPCEQINLASLQVPFFKNILSTMRDEVNELRRHAVPPRNKPTDPECDPSLHGFEWTSWKETNTAFGGKKIQDH